MVKAIINLLIFHYLFNYPKNDKNPVNLNMPKQAPKTKLIHTLNQNTLSSFLFFVVSSDIC